MKRRHLNKILNWFLWFTGAVEIVVIANGSFDLVWNDEWTWNKGERTIIAHTKRTFPPKLSKVVKTRCTTDLSSSIRNFVFYHKLVLLQWVTFYIKFTSWKSNEVSLSLVILCACDHQLKTTLNLIFNRSKPQLKMKSTAWDSFQFEFSLPTKTAWNFKI